MASFQLELKTPVQEHRLQGHENLEILIEPGEVANVLHLLLALRYDLTRRVVLIDPRHDLNVRLERVSPAKAGVAARTHKSDWQLSIPEQEIDAICRFMTEVILGVARVDHVDIQGRPHSQCDATVRVPVQPMARTY